MRRCPEHDLKLLTSVSTIMVIGLLMHATQRYLTQCCLPLKSWPFHEIVFSLFIQTTGAQLHFFCRNVSYRRCVDRLPPAVQHVEVPRLLLHVYVWKNRVCGRFGELIAMGTLKRTLSSCTRQVYVWKESVGGIDSRCRRWE